MPVIPETHCDLLNAPYATLATVGASGRNRCRRCGSSRPPMARCSCRSTPHGRRPRTGSATRKSPCTSRIRRTELAISSCAVMPPWNRTMTTSSLIVLESSTARIFAKGIGKASGAGRDNQAGPGASCRYAPARCRRVKAVALTGLEPASQSELE